MEPVEDELVDGRYLRAVAVGEPYYLFYFGSWLQGAAISRGPVAGHAHEHAGGVAVGGRFEGAGVGQAGGVEEDS